MPSLERPVLVLICVLAAGGCGGGGGGSTGPDQGVTGGTTSTASFRGTMASRYESGTIRLGLSAAASFATAAASSPTASGTVTLIDGSTIAVSGTFSGTAFSLSGGGLSINGNRSGPSLSATYSSGEATGSLQATVDTSTAPPPVTYCGTYVQGNAFGWLNVVTAANGTVAGQLAPGGPSGGTPATITGTLANNALTATTSAGLAIAGTLGSDGVILGTLGTAVPASPFRASVNDCGTANAGALASLAGAWESPNGQADVINLVLTQSGSSVSGSGAIFISSGLVPNYSGNAFKVTSGTFANAQVTFSADLGANPKGDGTFWVGTLAFTGTLTSGTTMTGSMTFTPPRTATFQPGTYTVSNISVARR